MWMQISSAIQNKKECFVMKWTDRCSVSAGFLLSLKQLYKELGDTQKCDSGERSGDLQTGMN